MTIWKTVLLCKVGSCEGVRVEIRADHTTENNYNCPLCSKKMFICYSICGTKDEIQDTIPKQAAKHLAKHLNDKI